MLRFLLLSLLASVVSAVEAPAGVVDAVSVWRLPGVTEASLWSDGVRRDSVPVPGGSEIRHAPRHAGTLTWRITTGTKELAAGTWTVAPAATPGGPVRLVGNRLQFPDGRPFLPLGPNLGWMGGDDPLPGFRRAFSRLAKAGGTHARVWLCSWSLGPGDDLDPQRLAQVDGVLAEARAQGLRLTLVLTNHTDLLRRPGWSAVPLVPGLARQIRDAVRRWGADDTVLAWELGNELDLAEGNPQTLDRWLSAAADLVRAEDPDRRPVIASWSGDGWMHSRAPVDWFGVHPYVHEFTEAGEAFRARDRDALRAFEDAARHGRPWWPMEGGYQGSEEHNPGNDLDHEGLLLRQHLWAGFCLGLAPAMNWWWDTHVDARNLWPLYGALGRVAARLDLADPDLQVIPPNRAGTLRVLGRSSPTQALVWPQVRADTWYAALVQGQPRTGLSLAQTVVLGGFRPRAGFTWERWDPVAGTCRVTAPVTSDDRGRLRLVLPAATVDEVWVLRLTADIGR